MHQGMVYGLFYFMQFKKFKYYLRNVDGLNYTVDRGNVIRVADDIELPNAPDGWKDQTIAFTRNNFYSNVFRSFTIPLRFVKSGAKILRTRLYKFGVEDIINMVITRLNFSTGIYENFYTGEVDFSQFEDSNEFFDINCAEGGIMKYLKAYEGTDYEIDLTGDNVVDIRMDGLELTKKINFAFTGENANFGYHTVGFVYTSEEGTSFGVITGNSPLADVAGFDVTTNDDRWFLKCVEGTIEFTVTGTVTVEITGIDQDYWLFLQKNDTTKVDLIPNQVLVVGTHTFTVNTTVTLNLNEKLFIACNKTEGFGHSTWRVYYSTETLAFSFKSTFKPTNVKAINALELGNRLLQKMCGTGYSLSSSLLNSCGIYLSSGDAIRGLAGAKIKTNWKSFFTSFNRNLNIGMSISGTVATIAAKASFFTSDLIYDLGVIKNAKFAFTEEFMFNSIKVGYPDQSYDDVNGKDEFNCTHQYTSVISRINKELDLTAPYRADPYGIEFVRINLENRTTVDSSSDNDTFMIDALPVGYPYILNRPAYSSITGISNPDTIFNTRLSPKRCLLKHGGYIRSALWLNDATNLTFQTTEKNSELETVLSGVTVTEKGDVLVSSLDAPYFIPIKTTFETIVPDTLTDIMASHGNGKFKFTYNGNDYYGYAMDAKQKPSGNEAQTWTLLLTAENNLETLIHG